MQEIIIDEEFRDLLPPLDREVYALLEENIIQHGCRDALVLWQGVLIDGHNRYGICTKHDIPFDTVVKDFASREEVMIWIITTQVSRRNLTTEQLSFFRGIHYLTEKKMVGNAGGRNQHSEELSQSGTIPQIQSTAEKLANQYRVSRNTIFRDAKGAEAINAIGEASPEAKRMILSREAVISKKALQDLSTMPKDDIQVIAAEIEAGTYEKKTPEPLPTVASPDSEWIQPPDTAAISRLTDGFQSRLRELADIGKEADLKAALRAHIDSLERLYRSM